MPSYAARYHAAKEEVACSRPKLAWLMYGALVLQVCSFLQIVGVVTWVLQMVVVAGPLLLANMLLAGLREGNFGAAWYVPAKAIFVQHHSAFGLCERQAPARGRSAWVIIQGVMILVLGLACYYLFYNVDLSPMPADANISCHKENVPLWIPCEYVSARDYNDCVNKVGWLFTPYCNSHIVISTIADNFGDVYILFLFGPLFSSIAWALLCAFASFTCNGSGGGCCRCVWAVPRDDDAVNRVRARAAEIDRLVVEASETFDNPTAIYFEVFLFVVDFLVMDLVGVVALVQTMNYQFAIVAFAIYTKTLWDQYRRGALLALYDETRRSARQGLQSDKLFLLLQSEKLEEAPLSIMLQYYAFPFVSFSMKAQISFVVSMAMALRSIVKGAYVHFHLDVDVFEEPADRPLVEQEEELVRSGELAD